MRPAAGGQGDDDPLIGRIIHNRVKIIRTIARGGMGKVYYGEQISLGRPCAIKILDPHIAQTEGEDFAKRFLLEASVNSKLKHPNVVTIFDYGETEEGMCFIAMEYLDGKTLAQELKDKGRIDPTRALDIIRQVARALREAHTFGVVHRDMKPGNVFLAKHDEEGDFAKVLDFGLVKETRATDDQHTQMGQIMGSPRYMAPEQIQGKEVDGRTDIYSLGAMLFAMIAGRPPFDKPNEMATMMAHVSEPVPLLGDVVQGLMLPGGVEEILYKCLEKDPNRRYASMDELLVALKLQGQGAMSSHSGNYTAVSGSGSHAAAVVLTSSGSHVVVPSVPPAKRGSKAAIFIGLAALAIGGGIFVATRPSEPAGGATVAASSSSTAPTVTHSTPTASVSVPIPPPIPTIVLHVETDPSGARVKEDGLEICASTPCDIVYKGDITDGGTEHLLEFTKAEYKVERKLVKATRYPYFLKMTRNR
jgi:serine/threonine protein kinase